MRIILQYTAFYLAKRPTARFDIDDGHIIRFGWMGGDAGDVQDVFGFLFPVLDCIFGRCKPWTGLISVATSVYFVWSHGWVDKRQELRQELEILVWSLVRTMDWNWNQLSFGSAVFIYLELIGSTC